MDTDPDGKVVWTKETGRVVGAVEGCESYLADEAQLVTELSIHVVHISISDKRLRS